VGLGLGDGDGVGGTRTGAGGPDFALPVVPGCGPGEPSFFGPGDGCTPVVCVCLGPCVGLGLGTPAFAAGAAVGGPAGFGDALGAVVAFTCATAAGDGDAVTLATGAGVAGLLVGAAVGAGGCGVGGFAVGGTEGTGVGAAVGGGRIATCCGPIEGIDVGTAGSWFCGLGS